MVFKDIPSPVGEIKLIATDLGLAAILWEGEDYQRTKLPVPERDDSNPILLQTASQLAEYFEKKRTTFDIPLDYHGTDFQRACGMPYLKSLMALQKPMAT